MAKTVPNSKSVTAFIKEQDATRQKECRAVMQVMRRVTRKNPKMWGTSIVGYGKYHYKYASGREGDFMITGFSPRKQALTVYVMDGFAPHKALMKKLGKYKTGKSCLYIKKLDDIDLDVLEKLIERSVATMKKTYATA